MPAPLGRRIIGYSRPMVVEEEASGSSFDPFMSQLSSLHERVSIGHRRNGRPDSVGVDRVESSEPDQEDPEDQVVTWTLMEEQKRRREKLELSPDELPSGNIGGPSSFNNR